jgi:3D (Asp-Asp-Asp) domain-containing protein
MKITLKVTISAFLLFIVITENASAGFFNWIKSANDNFVTAAVAETLATTTNDESSDVATIHDNAIQQTSTPLAPKPIQAKKAKRTYEVSVSAYSSTPDQTDDSPFITAKGTYVRDGIVAANFLPMGTAIKIPAIYGDKIFIVEDRMNKRYWYNMDIWMADRSAALKFGRKTLTIEIVSQ